MNIVDTTKKPVRPRIRRRATNTEGERSPGVDEEQKKASVQPDVANEEPTAKLGKDESRPAGARMNIQDLLAKQSPCRSEKNKTTTALRDRPLAIDEGRLTTLLLVGCTDVEIAGDLGVPLDQLLREYGAELERQRLIARVKFKRQIFSVAVRQGDPGLLRFIAGNICGWAGDPQLRELRALQIAEKKAHMEAAQMQAQQLRELRALQLEEKRTNLETAKLGLELRQLEVREKHARVRLLELEARRGEQQAASEEAHKQARGLSDEEMRTTAVPLLLKLVVEGLDAEQRATLLNTVREARNSLTQEPSAAVVEEWRRRMLAYGLCSLPTAEREAIFASANSRLIGKELGRGEKA